MKGGTNKLPFLCHITTETMFLSLSPSSPPLAAEAVVLGSDQMGDGRRRHCAATVREDGGGTAGGGAAEVVAAAAGEGGDAGWPWPWEPLRWRRHLNDPACVAGAQTHLGPAPCPWLWAEDAEDQLLRMCFGDAAAAPVGVVLWWWW